MISVEHLTKCYGGFKAVDDLSLIHIYSAGTAEPFRRRRILFFSGAVDLQPLCVFTIVIDL